MFKVYHIFYFTISKPKWFGLVPAKRENHKQIIAVNTNTALGSAVGVAIARVKRANQGAHIHSVYEADGCRMVQKF